MVNNIGKIKIFKKYCYSLQKMKEYCQFILVCNNIVLNCYLLFIILFDTSKTKKYFCYC
jgi:hypothetical protein